MLHKPNSIEAKLDAYLEERSMAWAPTTLRVESAILWSLIKDLNGDPTHLMQVLKCRQKSHSTFVTTWGRVVSFWSYAFGEDNNPYKDFKLSNKRQFKHTYFRKEVNISYEEAKERILSITDDAVRTKALNLLQNGMRYNESTTAKDGFIIGKGNKKRKLLLPLIAGPEYTKSYRQFWFEMRKIGLTPHQLRKLAATRLVEMGLKEADLLKIFGWSSIQTASLYVQPKRDAELAEIMKQAFEK